MPPAEQRAVWSRYELLDEIGRGGMGVVYRAHDLDVGRDVALKVLLAAHRDNPEALRRFAEEAQIGGQLEHPGVVPVYDLGVQADDRPYFAMRLVRGETLSKLLADRVAPSDDLRRYLTIFEQVCQAVAFAHASGVVHRDLKPGNVMVGAFGEVQVVDWGLAKILDDGRSSPDVRAPASESPRAGPRRGGTALGSVFGTPAYMSPEQARGEVDGLDERSDVFALGAMLCEILTAQPPYAEIDDGDALASAARAALGPALHRLRACGADDALVGIARRCLAREPEARFADAGALAAALGAYLSAADKRVRTAELEAAEQRVRVRAERRARKLTSALAAAAIVVVLVGGGSWVWIRGQRHAEQQRVERQLGAAMQETLLLRAQAEAAGTGSPVLWDHAVAAAQRTAQLAGGDWIPAERRREVSDLRAAVESGQRDQRFLTQLLEARTPGVVDSPWQLVGVDEDQLQHRQASGRFYRAHFSRDAARERARGVSRAYASAFRDYGVDVEALSPLDAERAFGSDVRKEASAALDRWGLAQRTAELAEGPSPRHLHELAGRLDPGDAWFSRLRARLSEPTVGREELAELAATLDYAGAPVATVELLGQALLDLDDAEDAIRILSAGRSRHPTDFGINLALGLAWLQTLATDVERIVVVTRGAAECLRVCVALRPDSGILLAMLGETLARSGDLDGALAAHRAAYELAPDDARVQHLFASTCGRLDDLDRTVAGYRRALALDPSCLETWHALAFWLERQGRMDDALDCLRTAVELRPELAVNHASYAAALARANQLEDAVQSANRALDADPDHVFALEILSHVYQRLGRLDDAIEQARRAAALEPDQPQLHQRLGGVLFLAGRLDEALVSHRRALAIDPDFAIPYAGIGLILDLQGKPDEALASYQRALELDPESPRVLENYSVALVWRGQLEQAVDYARRAVAVDPGAAGCHAQLGNVLIVLRHYDEAVASLRRAIELDASIAEAHTGLGTALLAQGHIDEAITTLERATRLVHQFRANEGAVWCCLGRAYAARGDVEAAIAALEHATRVAPDSADVHFTSGRVLLIELGRVSQALPYLRRAHELGSRSANWRQPTAALIGLGTAMAPQEQRLERLASGAEVERSAADALHMASIALRRRWFLLAAQLYDEGLATDQRPLRWTAKWYDAATAAAQVGRADESQAGAVSDEERVRCRQRALSWLRRDVELAFGALESGQFSRTGLRDHLADALASPKLAALRDGDSLRELPDTEAREWRSLWREMQGFVAQTDARRAELDERLQELNRGATPAAAITDCSTALELCDLAREQKEYAVAADLFEGAAQLDAAQAAALRYPIRYNAACAAARAGTGLDSSARAAALDDAGRARYRALALAWLRAELAREVAELAADPAQGQELRRRATHWLHDPDFARVREPDQLGQLAEAEAEAWRALWPEVARFAGPPASSTPADGTDG
ncbi:MAG: tetratricopeptide repeat protein [Planctomycetes bacterium]|nr:tetratricopeptide repeat protein [Planctomycetota bacterium]